MMVPLPPPPCIVPVPFFSSSTSSTEIFSRVLFVRVTAGSLPSSPVLGIGFHVNPFVHVCFARVRVLTYASFLEDISGSYMATPGRDFQLQNVSRSSAGSDFPGGLKGKIKRDRGTIYCAIFAGENIRGSRFGERERERERATILAIARSPPCATVV